MGEFVVSGGRYVPSIAARQAPSRVCAALLLTIAALGLGLGLGLAAQRANAEGACPNEAIRAEAHSLALPECRAYELVSPVYQGGWPTPLGPIAEGPEGEVRVEARNGAAIAGAEQDGFPGAIYILTRTSTGWMTTAISPSASVFSRSNLDVLSTDLSGSLLQVQLDGREYLYRREFDGELAPVGPIDAVTQAQRDSSQHFVVAASSDISHVLVEIQQGTLIEAGLPNANWPGNETVAWSGGRSLYEYTGTGNSEPTLVGVANAGAPPWKSGATHLNEGAQLISECGTVLGGHQGDLYNAVSSDGQVVFFTGLQDQYDPEDPGLQYQCLARAPVVDELYTRVAGEHTIAISEPSLSIPGRQCTGVCLTDETTAAGRREGIFAGASADGRKVFFLTEQPLVDEDEDDEMDLYMAEFEGEGAAMHIGRLVQVSHDPVVGQAADVQGVMRVSENGERVYFVAKGALTSKPDLSLPAGHQTAVAGGDNLYVYDTSTHETAFVATFATGTACGEISDDACDWGLVDERPVQATEGGEYLVFISSTDLTAGDTSTVPQLFEYDATSGTLARVSIGEEGFNEDGNIDDQAYRPVIGSPKYGTFDEPAAGEARLDVARDGAVFFESADGLTPGALNRVVAGVSNEQQNVYAQNIYEYREGHVYLISDGHDTGQIANVQSTVSLTGITPSGDDVLFRTADALTAQDTDTADTNVHTYDARVDGGFPAPAPGDLCGEGACREPFSSSASPALAGGSETAQAGDNAASSTSAQPSVKSVAAPPKSLTRAQKLAQALKVCRKDTRERRRVACERVARGRYGPVKGKATQGKAGR
jgi:hypothetical protein